MKAHKDEDMKQNIKTSLKIKTLEKEIEIQARDNHDLMDSEKMYLKMQNSLNKKILELEEKLGS